MTENDRTIRCPDCGAANGPGAFRCVGCGAALGRGGMAARPVDDDDDEPRRPIKKPARPGPDAVRKGAPPAKKPARPVDDEDDEPRRTVKKKVRRPADEDEADDEPESIRDNPILNLFFPVGVSLWALSSNYLGGFGLLGTFAGFLLGTTVNKWVGVGLASLSGLFCLLAIPLGGLAFILRPKKATYGHLTGYVRAVIGILCGLAGVVAAGVVLFMLFSMRL
jgi:hypothetical protein